MNARHNAFRFAALALALALSACASDKDEQPEDTSPSGCGTPETISITITGTVQGTGGPVSGATVRFTDRAWSPGTLDEQVTGADGTFTLNSDNVTWLPRCVATALSYWVEAELDAASDEKAVNQRIFNAIDDGTYAFDLDQFPLTLE